MTIQIPLKRKYLTAKRSRYHAVGDDGAKRQKKLGTAGYTPPYHPREHVLYLKPTGGTVMVHGEEARKLLGDE